MPDELVIPAPSDYHLHLRQGSTTRAVASASAWAGRVLVMPNTDPPVLDAAGAAEYGMLCGTALPRTEIVTTIKLTPATTPEIIRTAAQCGVLAAKLYPAGATTNSNDGIPGDWLACPVPQRFADVLGEMEKVGMVLCCHGEMPGKPTLWNGSSGWPLAKSGAFLFWVAKTVVNSFRELRIVLEHISTGGEADWVRSNWADNPGHFAATVTPHHLTRTIEDLIGGNLNPHEFCKPVPKFDFDRKALVAAATSVHPAFFLGTDSAPHDTYAKEVCGCAGVFNAHAALGTLAEVFERAAALSHLVAFTSGNGDAFYRREPTKRRIVLAKAGQRVPDFVYVNMPNGTDRTIRPWRAGEALTWSWREVT